MIFLLISKPNCAFQCHRLSLGDRGHSESLLHGPSSLPKCQRTPAQAAVTVPVPTHTPSFTGPRPSQPGAGQARVIPRSPMSPGPQSCSPLNVRVLIRGLNVDVKLAERLRIAPPRRRPHPVSRRDRRGHPKAQPLARPRQPALHGSFRMTAARAMGHGHVTFH